MLLSSGDEVVAIDVKPGPSQIRNSNLPMIAHLLERMGGDVIDEQWLPDDVALDPSNTGDMRGGHDHHHRRYQCR